MALLGVSTAFCSVAHSIRFRISGWCRARRRRRYCVIEAGDREPEGPEAKEDVAHGSSSYRWPDTGAPY